MSIAVDVPVQNQSLIGRSFSRLLALLVGTILALTGPSALILLGWLMRQTRSAAFQRAGLLAQNPGWLLGAPGRGYLQRALGGLAANIREGFLAVISLSLATFPYAAAWSLAWWAGWENSFSKGYEQAFVGPALGISGIILFCLTMIYLPMALAHQAVEGRAFALFEYRQVKSAVRRSGWRYVFLAAATVFLALPIFGSRILVVFAEGIYPAIADFTPSQFSDLASAILLAKAAYVVITLAWLRRWSGRIYADAVLRAQNGRDSELWKGGALSGATYDGPTRKFFPGRPVRFIALFIVWLAFAFWLFFTQFMNFSWAAWITQPYTFLPWVY